MDALSTLGGDWVAVVLLDDESRADVLTYFSRLDEGGIYLASDLAKLPSTKGDE